MSRHHNINGNIVPFTAEEEAARDAEEVQREEGTRHDGIKAPIRNED